MSDSFKQPIVAHNTKKFTPLGYCMYCGKIENISKDNLTDEHIIPRFMAGGYILEKSSCEKCNEITKIFEGNLAEEAFLGLRKQLNYVSGKKSCPIFYIISLEKDKLIERYVSSDELPPVFAGLEFEPPGIIDGRKPDAEIKNLKIIAANISNRVSEKKSISGKIEIPCNPVNMMRLAAKIAHGFFHSTAGFEHFDTLLNDVILTGQHASYFVGSPIEKLTWPEHMKTKGKLISSHNVTSEYFHIDGDNLHIYLILYIQLFSHCNGPCFEVVTARRKIPGYALLNNISQINLPTSNGEDAKAEGAIIHITVTESNEYHNKLESLYFKKYGKPLLA